MATYFSMAQYEWWVRAHLDLQEAYRGFRLRQSYLKDEMFYEHCNRYLVDIYELQRSMPGIDGNVAFQDQVDRIHRMDMQVLDFEREEAYNYGRFLNWEDKDVLKGDLQEALVLIVDHGLMQEVFVLFANMDTVCPQKVLYDDWVAESIDLFDNMELMEKRLDHAQADYYEAMHAYEDFDLYKPHKCHCEVGQRCWRPCGYEVSTYGELLGDGRV